MIRRGSAIVVALVLAASCSGGGGTARRTSTSRAPSAPATTTVPLPRIDVDAVGPTGVAHVTVTMAPARGANQVVLSATASTTEWRAAAWDAVAVASLLDGVPCTGHRFTFRADGPTHDTSAHALLAVAVLALLRGEHVRRGVSLLGGIEPAGTIGPVDSAVARAAVARSAGITTLLVPVGQRPSSGEPGAVREVATIDAAYPVLTGHPLPAVGPAPGASSALASAAATRLRDATNRQLADVQSAQHSIAGLPAVVREALAPIVTQARSAANRAQQLEGTGALAGAFVSAHSAATTAGAAAAAGRTVAQQLERSVDAFIGGVRADLARVRQAVATRARALDATSPAMIADLSPLLAAHGALNDAGAIASYAGSLITSFAALPASTPHADLVRLALTSAFYDALAEQLVGYSDDLAAIMSASGGPRLGGASVTRVASSAPCLAAAASANLAVFDDVVTQTRARQDATSVADARAALEAEDLDVVLTIAPAGAGRSAAAQLGASIARFARSLQLLDRYAGYRVKLDTHGNIQIVTDPAALTSELTRAAAQLGSVLTALGSAHVTPVVELGTAAVAGLDRTGTPDDQMAALGEYGSAFVSARVLDVLAAATVSP